MAKDKSPERHVIEHNFVNDILGIRDYIEPIAKGERNTHIKAKRSIHPGTKKLTLKEAQQIATHAIARINLAVNRFDEAIREWERTNGKA